MVAALFDVSRRFHAQPREAKDAININRFHRGYMAPKTSLIVTSLVQRATKPNNSESFMLMHEVGADDPRHGEPLQGPNQWPADVPGFREAVTAYNAALETLAKRFTRLIWPGLPLCMKPSRLQPSS